MHGSPTTRRSQVVAAAALATTALVGGSAYASTAQSSAPQTTSAGTAVTTVAHHQWQQQQAPDRARVHLTASSPALKACFPHAGAKVSVDLTTDAIGKDRFRIKAHGLKPRTDFTVFLIEKAGAPFGAVEYIGDFTTNRHGRAHNTYKLIVEEAFAFNNETQDRTDLDSVGVWFADEKDDDGCLGAAGPVTGFDGDAKAGVQMLNSGTHLLP